jgi:lipopolysaccharide transport system permease protein
VKKRTRQQLDLLILLIKKEITLKYKRTYLGFLWSLLNPLLTALALFVAFKIIMRFQMKDYTLFLLTALFPWTWFSMSVVFSANTLIQNVSLIKKVIFPKNFLVLAVILSQLVNLLFAIPILVGFVFYYDRTPSPIWILGIPIIVCAQFMITYGISLIVAMVNAFFRDMEHIINVSIQLLFWGTPIIYPLDMIPAKLRPLLALNPVTYIIQSWRDLIMNNVIDWEYVGISFVTGLACLLLGRLIFNHFDKTLDEVL